MPLRMTQSRRIGREILVQVAVRLEAGPLRIGSSEDEKVVAHSACISLSYQVSVCEILWVVAQFDRQVPDSSDAASA